MDQRIPRRAKSSIARLSCVCMIVNLGGLLVGIHLAVFSGILEMPSFHELFHETGTSAKSFVTSALIVGAIIGSVPAGPLLDKHGRRLALMLTAFLFGTATILMVCAKSIATLALGRCIAGVGYAIANVVCPMYTAEIAPTSARGMFVNMYQLLITVGIFAAQLVNAMVWEQRSWTYPLFLALIPAVSMFALVWLYVPESNVWLQSRMMSDIEGEKVNTPTVKELFRDPAARRRLFIGVGMSTSQQLTGINGVIFFAPALVADVLSINGSSGPFLAAAAVGVANLLATIGAMFLVDRFGRRQLLLLAGPPIIASLTTLGAMRNGYIATSDIIGLGALLTFIAAFAVTYGPLTFVVCSEVFPVRYKGAGMGFCSFILMVSCLLVSGSFLPLLEWLKGGVYFIYAVCVVGTSLFVWRFVPETKNLSLKEIEQLLDNQD